MIIIGKILLDSDMSVIETKLQTRDQRPNMQPKVGSSVASLQKHTLFTRS